MAYVLSQRTQNKGCLPQTQSQLLKHNPQSYLPKGDVVLSHNPLGLEEVSRFPGTQPGSPFMVLHHRKFAQKENPRFFNEALEKA